MTDLERDCKIAIEFFGWKEITNGSETFIENPEGKFVEPPKFSALEKGEWKACEHEDGYPFGSRDK
jgi:hypothetical protein